MTTIFLADPTLKDNECTPVIFESEDHEEVVFAISQSRLGTKTEGQDVISAVLRNQWECCVLCDGHDLHGHLVARGICEMLANLLIDKVENFDLKSKEAEMAIIEAFDECERAVMWSNESLSPNSFVRVVEGEWQGLVGYVSEVHAATDEFSIIIVDKDAYHRPRLPRSAIVGARFVGGCTCVAFIRDSAANLVRIAVMGDTRSMAITAKGETGKVLKSDPLWERIDENVYLTFPHDVFNTAELRRLKAEWNGEFEIDGPYLINPLTGCEIQPTRGFGDFDMYGTGYISIPDVSKPFPLESGTIVLIASDGVFDDNVWPDFSDVAKFITKQVKEGKELDLVADALHKETVKRSLAGDYVDDISFFMCWTGNPNARQAQSNVTTRSSASAAAPPLAPSKAPSSPPQLRQTAAALSKEMGLPPLAPPRASTTPAVAASASAAGGGSTAGGMKYVEGVEGLENLRTPGSSFVSSTGSFAGWVPRQSMTLSEAADFRRISAVLPANTVAAAVASSDSPKSQPVLSGLLMISGAAPRGRSSTENHLSALREMSSSSAQSSNRKRSAGAHSLGARSQRAATETFLDPAGGPRYLKEKRASLHVSSRERGDSLRHQRGPSFLLPDGLTKEDETILAQEAQIHGTGLHLDVIGEGEVLKNAGVPAAAVTPGTTPKKLSAVMANNIGGAISSGGAVRDGGSGARDRATPSPPAPPTSPADHVRQITKTRRATERTEELRKMLASGVGKDALVSSHPQVNVVLQRMAEKYNHDLKKLEMLLKDLDVV